MNFGKISKNVCHDSHFSKCQKRSVTCVLCDIFRLTEGKPVTFPSEKFT